MRPLTCTATRRRLQAFYDGELPVADQIAVQAHMDWCDACAATLEDLRFLGTALRNCALGHDSLSHEEATALAATVVSRRKAEQDASFFARAQRMFDDMHLVYAGVGATAATAVCVVIMLSMLRFASFGRPDATPAADGRSDSLAAMLDVLATPGSSADAMAIDSASHARWAARLQAANETAEQDAVFALDAIVTRDGRLPNLASPPHPRPQRRAQFDRGVVGYGDAGADRAGRDRRHPGGGEQHDGLARHPHHRPRQQEHQRRPAAAARREETHRRPRRAPAIPLARA